MWEIGKDILKMILMKNKIQMIGILGYLKKIK